MGRDTLLQPGIDISIGINSLANARAVPISISRGLAGTCPLKNVNWSKPYQPSVSLDNIRFSSVFGKYGIILNAVNN